MSSTRQQIITIIFLLTLILFGCSKKDTNIQNNKFKIKHIIQNTWGIDFNSKPIAKESQRIQKLSKAVAFIEFASGGSATGFFISPDGLFLTNEHAISRTDCSNEQCIGIKIIRDFSPNGKPQVYTKIHPLAQNKSLDYSLVKVELPTGETVPYLEIDIERDNLKERDLLIIGHPLGSSLRTSKANYYSKNRSKIYLKSVAISGNSGSPLLDEITGKVIGLYYAGFWDKHSTNKTNGDVQHFGLAHSLKDIVNNIQNIYPEAFSKQPISMKNFSATNLKDHKFLDTIPKSRAELLLNKEKELDTCVGQTLGMKEEQKCFSSVMRILYNDYNNKSVSNFKDINNFFKSIWQINLINSSQVNLAMDELVMLIDTYKNESADSQNYYTESFKIQYGLKSQEECIKRIQDLDYNHTVYKLYDYSRECLLSTLDGKNILQLLISDYNSIEQDATSEYLLDKISDVIYFQTKLMNSISTKQKNELLEILLSIANQIENMNKSFWAEQVYTKIKHNL